jgi:hypothetical protein
MIEFDLSTCDIGYCWQLKSGVGVLIIIPLIAFLLRGYPFHQYRISIICAPEGYGLVAFWGVPAWKRLIGELDCWLRTDTVGSFAEFCISTRL